MPRSARLDAPGVLHHIIIRGIERRVIFKDDEDREDFLSRLGKLLPATKTSCFAWALIPNHAHFLFRTGSVPVATLMRRLLTGYAGYFNRRHKRSGQLFQNRYKSILCQEEPYFSELVRYIHLNPLRAGLVKNLTELNQYAYCGHGVLMGNRRREWQGADYVLCCFGKQASSARRHYCAFVEAGIDQGRRDELTGGGLIRSLGGWSAINKRDLRDTRIKSDERILGDGDFVDALLSETNERFERYYEIRRRGFNLEKIAEHAEKLCEVAVDDIFSRSKQPGKVKARSLFCYWASSALGIKHLELARRIGISGPGVGTCVERGKQIAAEDGYRLLERIET
jgi:REP element-mobilizing transposase RayT